MSAGKPRKPNLKKFVTTKAVYQWDDRLGRYVELETHGYWYDGPWALAHDVSPVWVCEDYRWRNDNGSITTATWIAAENTAVVGADGILPGNNVRLRVNFGETAGAAGTGEVTGSWTLQWRKDSGTWTTLTSTGDCKTFDSTNLTNGTALATANFNLTWGGAGTNQAWGDENEDGVTPSNGPWSKDFAEAEFSIQFDGTGNVGGEVYTFRMLDPESNVCTFTNVPTLTLDTPSKTCSGAPSTPLPTASGAAAVHRAASGAPSTPLPTATGAATVQAVWLNTSQSKTGAVQQTVTAWADTSITITSVKGALSSGTIYAAVENASGLSNWYQIRVVDQESSGAPSTPLPTASGAAEIGGMHTASGAPSTPLPTASGAATVRKTASGTPSTPLPTASGAATVRKQASGAPSTPLPTAAGVSEVRKQASGAPSTPLPTASGAATVRKTASGAPSTSLPTASGVVDVHLSASGTPSTPLPTASGAAAVHRAASGAPSTPLPTAAGSATVVTSKTASGSPSTPLPTATGGAAVHRAASTGPNGAFTYISSADGHSGSGAPSITHGLTIQAGDLLVAYVHINSVGAISADQTGWTEAADLRPNAAETSQHACYWKIAGVSEPATYSWTGSGGEWGAIIKQLRPPSAHTVRVDLAASTDYNGTATNNLQLDAGNSETLDTNAVSIKMGGKDNRLAGTYTTATNSYVSVVGHGTSQHHAMAHRLFPTGGTVPTTTISTVSQSDNTYSIHISFVAVPSPETPLPTASGSATVSAGETASGAPSTPLPTASGAAEVRKQASGSPSTPLATASGAAVVHRAAAGAPSTPLPTAAGVAEVRKTASGSPSAPLPTAAGVAEVRKTASGSPSTPLPTASGSATVRKTSSGTPSTPLPTASGSATVLGVHSASGAPSTPLPTATGSATVRKQAAGSPSTPLPTAAGVATVAPPVTASGAPFSPLPTATGAVTVRKTASGSPSTPLPTAAGTATVRKTASGSPVTAAPTATGTANIRVAAVHTATGAAQTPAVISGGVIIRRVTADARLFGVFRDRNQLRGLWR